MGSAAVDEIYQKSKEYSAANDETLHAIQLIIVDYFQEGYPFHGAVEGRDEQGWDVMAHYNYQAARSKNLDEFRSRTQGVIPLVKQQILFRALKTLEPVYHRLIWTPNLSQLKRDQARLDTMIKKSETEKLISLQAKFYRATWEPSDAFTMMLIPIPVKKASTHATVIGNTGLVQILKEENDLAGRYGVMMHEIGHSLYASETPEFQQQLANWFLQSKVPTAKIAYQNMEEVLSTITGNGWAYERASGHEDASEWYNNKEFNELSKALYPLAKTYLDAGKEIDKSFVDTAIDEFQKTFPDALRRNRRILRRILLLSDGTFGDDSELKAQALSKHKWIRQVEVIHSITSAEALAAISERKLNCALIILLKVADKDQLGSLQKLIPELSAMKNGLKDKTFATMLDGKGRLLMMIQAVTASDLAQVLDRINPDDATAAKLNISPY